MVSEIRIRIGGKLSALSGQQSAKPVWLTAEG
jgi:hypothetical protein